MSTLFVLKQLDDATLAVAAKPDSWTCSAEQIIVRVAKARSEFTLPLAEAIATDRGIVFDAAAAAKPRRLEADTPAVAAALIRELWEEGDASVIALVASRIVLAPVEDALFPDAPADATPAGVVAIIAREIEAAR